MALYTVRSDRQLCEQLQYNLLFRWFLDLTLDDPGLDQSNFSRLRARLVETDVARRFFDAVVRIARHESSTDPEARLHAARQRQPARLCYGGHVLMENRSGLCVDLLVTRATLPQPAAAA